MSAISLGSRTIDPLWSPCLYNRTPAVHRVEIVTSVWVWNATHHDATDLLSIMPSISANDEVLVSWLEKLFLMGAKADGDNKETCAEEFQAVQNA